MAKGSSHVCTLQKDKDEVILWLVFKERWEKKRSEKGEGALSYTRKKRMDRFNKHNEGVSHFGIHPDLLPRSKIRFDTFHLKCFITSHLVESVRFLLDYQSDELT